MRFSLENILGFISLVLLVLSAREYLSNGRKVSLKLKAQLKVSAIFCIVILFNLLISKN